MATNVISSSPVDNPYLDRRILTYIEVIERKYQAVKVMARGKTYADLVFESNVDKVTLTEQVLYPLLIETTMIEWIHTLFTEANVLQEFAATYFTFANRGTNQIQVTMYEQKYNKAKEYIFNLNTFAGTLAEAKLVVTVPTMIFNEANLLSEDPFELSNAIIDNYIGSNEAMTAYYGLIEGERRLAKRRILACMSIEDLKNVVWANWPEFVPPDQNIGS